MGCWSIAGLFPALDFAGAHLYTWVEKGAVREEDNTMSLARA